jgi:hypothetical protein
VEENIRDSALTIGTTPLLISIEKLPGTRTALAITNTSAGGQVLSLSWGKTATALNGIVLYPGGSWSESVDQRFTPSNKEIWIVSSAAGGTAAQHERTIGTGL